MRILILAVAVVFTPAGTANRRIKMKFTFEENGKQLTLSQTEPLCYEGCAYRFRNDQ